MLTTSLSPLTWNLIVICLVWLTAIVIIRIIRTALLKSLNTAAEGNNQEMTERILSQKSKVKQAATILTSLATATAIISLIVFILFMNSSNVKTEAETEKIQQAPLPENFKPQTLDEIKQSNKKAVSAKSEELQEKATRENSKAMKDAINIFKQAK